MKELFLAVLLLASLFLAGCVQPTPPVPPPPTGDLYDVCSEQELRDYVVGYAGTDEALVQEFEDFCIAQETDLSGCPVDMTLSYFDIGDVTSGGVTRSAGLAECSSVCERDAAGNPLSGHQLFAVFYYIEPTREIFYLRAGIFKVRCD